MALASQGSVAAAAGNGLRVSPVRTDLTINPGSAQTVNVTVTNVTDAPESLQAVVNDFTANPDESGNPVLYLGTNQYAPSHSLKHFVQPIPNFSLQPGQERSVPVVITVPSNTAGGGYYGVVRFAPATSSSSNTTVTLAGSVGSLILLTVPGNIVNELSIAGFNVASGSSESSFLTSNKNINAIIRLQNEGNIQEEPFGKVLLKNHSGKMLSETEINNVYPPANVLPDSIRKFSIPISKVGSFGIYTLEGNFGYGTNGQLLSASTTFYVVPIAAIIIFILVVLLIIFLIFVLPRLIKSYNKRIVQKAARRR
jgi:hypothetical protein